MTIWDTVAALREHPALMVAIELVKENIENRLSECYKIADTPTCNHKEVLLGLNGRFALRNSEELNWATTTFDTRADTPVRNTVADCVQRGPSPGKHGLRKQLPSPSGKRAERPRQGPQFHHLCRFSPRTPGA